MLDPVSGQVVEVDASVAPLVEELWARLGGSPQNDTDSPAAPTQPDTPARRGPVGTPSWRRRETRIIVPWSAQTCAKVAAGLPDRYAAMVPAGQSTGLRFGELSALAVEDLDRRQVLVRRQVKRVDGCLVWAMPKGGKQRTLPLDRHLSAILHDHQARHDPAPVTLPWYDPDGQRETFRVLFANEHGRPLDRAYFERRWRTAVSDAGMTPNRSTGTHQLRHHFASELVAAGTDLETVRRLLGHADVMTTAAYIHSLAISDQQARRAVAKVTPRPKRPAALPAGVADFGAYRIRRTS